MKKVKYIVWGLALMLNIGSIHGQEHENFIIQNGDLELQFKLHENKYLRAPAVVPTGYQLSQAPKADYNTAYEVFLFCSGDMRSAHNGKTGINLQFVKKREENIAKGKRYVLEQFDPEQKLKVESFYDFLSDSPVVRRFVRVTNEGRKAVGIEYLSSAILNSFNEILPGHLDDNIRIHYAHNSLMNEAQWQVRKPSDFGRAHSFNPSHSRISFSSLGSMSTRSYLPMGMIEHVQAGLTWFWQIEHNGSWEWSLGDTGGGSYVYIGGPDEEHGHAWKELAPGEMYETVPVGLGVVKGGVDAAAAALSHYRRTIIHPHADNKTLPVIFNDYNQSLWANPSTAKILPLVDAAAAAGCDYYVTDAGWYAEEGEGWYDKIGKWEATKSRFPNGLEEVMDSIRAKGMKPGIWLEIEVAGVNSILKDKPDSWFMMRRGKRVEDSGRFMLDFRNPQVRAYADEVVDRLIERYGITYFKVDYNSKEFIGTDVKASSAGQGLLAHNRAVLQWYKDVLQRHPGLVIESCASGGNRLDYAMLSTTQLASFSDQGDYKKAPAIVVGGTAGILPEQLAVWSLPLAGGDAREASFNMVNSMLTRIHLGGQLATLSKESQEQVKEGIAVYKEKLASFIPNAVPFYPLGMPSLADDTSPIALGLKGEGKSYVAVWRLNGGNSNVSFNLPSQVANARVIYPSNLGVKTNYSNSRLQVTLPHTFSAAIIEVDFE